MDLEVQYKNLSGLGPVLPLLWDLEGFRCVFPLIFQNWGFWDFWDFWVPRFLGYPRFLGCPRFLGLSNPNFWSEKCKKNVIFFLGYPRNLGFFWGWARSLEYSNVFYVCSRRFWILLLSVIVTHTHTIHLNVHTVTVMYINVFLLCVVWLLGAMWCVTPNFWGEPQFFGVTPKTPQFLGIHPNFLG